MKCISELLGLHGSTLGRILKGERPLRLHLVLEVLALVRAPPEDFFADAYPLGGEAVTQLAAPQVKTPGGARMKVLVDTLGKKLARATPPEQIVASAQVWLRDALVVAGVTQRRVSRELGFGEDALGQALRGNSELTFTHIFAVLDAAQVPPARFFFELFLPKPVSEAESSQRAQIVGLFERGVGRTAAALCRRRQLEEPEAGGSAPRS